MSAMTVSKADKNELSVGILAWLTIPADQGNQAENLQVPARLEENIRWAVKDMIAKGHKYTMVPLETKEEFEAVKNLGI
jgi:hypothetical protein